MKKLEPTVLDVNSGREFFGGPEALEKQGRNPNRGRQEEFAEKFAGNSPTIRQTKINNSTQIHSAEPHEQNLVELRFANTNRFYSRESVHANYQVVLDGVPPTGLQLLR